LADKINATSAAITTEIPAAQSSIQELADAIKNFKLSGPLGIHGQST
jgi:hypothetical protein